MPVARAAFQNAYPLKQSESFRGLIAQIQTENAKKTKMYPVLIIFAGDANCINFRRATICLLQAYENLVQD